LLLLLSCAYVKDVVTIIITCFYIYLKKLLFTCPYLTSVHVIFTTHNLKISSRKMCSSFRLADNFYAQFVSMFVIYLHKILYPDVVGGY
jgi:hypothetical protein